MRIAHVVLSLDVGGQERLILSLSRELMRRGHDVRVLSLTRGGTLREQFDGIPIVDVPRRDAFDPLLVPRIARALWTHVPDVVHTHNAAPLIYAAPAARAARVKRVVHTKHGSNTYSKRALWLARGAARTISSFVAVSEETAIRARRDEHPSLARVRVVPNGIPLAQFARDTEARDSVRRELGIPGDAVVVGSVGRLVEEKDYPLLVRAVAPLANERLRLVLAGEGPSRGEILGAIPAHAAPFITLTGMRKDIPRLMSALDVFCLSSRTEGLPLVVPEAMACSLPIVATRVGGLPGIVPKDVGVLVPHGDAEALREAIASLAHDGARRHAMGEAARAHAYALFSLERMTRDYERLYEGLF